MTKVIPKKVRGKIIKLRDVECLGWEVIRQQTSLHRDTVRKHYLLEKGEGLSPLAPGKAL